MASKYILRPYQVQAVDTAMKYLNEYGKPFVIQMATGAGKSLVIAEICHRLNEPVLILQPSKELLEQNYAKLVSYGIEDIGIYSASKNSKNIAKFTYATIGSIYKHPELFGHFKYVLIDECHLVNPKNLQGMYARFLNAISAERVCGLTATPYRLVQKFVTYNGEMYYTSSLRMLNRIHPFFFKAIPYKIETSELIEQGYLAPIEYMSEKILLDELKVNTTGADFTAKSLDLWAMNRAQRIAAVTGFVAKSAKRTLVFCSTIAQANSILTHLEAAGSHPMLVTGQTPPKEREALVRAYRQTTGAIMLNVGVFTTGFDVPELDCVILGRPTMSVGLYYQMVGRGVRIDPNNPKKILRVFDLAGITDRMGRVESIRLGKEDAPNQWKDKLVSEIGRLDEVPLFTFKLKPKEVKSEEN